MDLQALCHLPAAVCCLRPHPEGVVSGSHSIVHIRRCTYKTEEIIDLQCLDTKSPTRKIILSIHPTQLMVSSQDDTHYTFSQPSCVVGEGGVLKCFSNYFLQSYVSGNDPRNEQSTNKGKIWTPFFIAGSQKRWSFNKLAQLAKSSTFIIAKEMIMNYSGTSK